MNRANIRTWFRRRMLPLVVVSSALFASATPVAYVLVKSSELAATARADAERVGLVVRESAEQRPRLWRYDAAKLGERLAIEGLDDLASLAVYDERGAAVPIGPSATDARAPSLLWGQAKVTVDGEPIASIWVGVSRAPLIAATVRLACVFALLAFLFGGALYLLPMRAIRAAEARVQALIDRLAETLPENERRRIARELHDGVGQALTAARLYLVALKRTTEDDTAVATIARQIDESIDEVRRATHALSPAALESGALGLAIERHCRTFAKTTGLTIVCELAPELPPLDRETETACYRIVQEALSNVARHSRGRRAWVRLAWSGSMIELSIDDDGVGFVDPPSPGGGLATIRERVAALGGRVECSTREGGGARVKALIALLGGAT